MTSISNILQVVLLIFAVVMSFNLIIFVHELGHFLAARWRGLKIERFQIWFGSGDDGKLFRRDESAFYADRSKANIGGAFLRARHAGTPGSRA